MTETEFPEFLIYDGPPQERPRHIDGKQDDPVEEETDAEHD